MAKAPKKETKMTAEHHPDHHKEPEASPAPSVRSLIIQGNTFKVREPFAAGHVLSPGEASALNQLFAENMRNAFSKKIGAELEKTPGQPLSSEALAQFQADLNTYAAGYSFDSKTRQRAPRIVDAVERKLNKLAEQAVVVMLNGKGYQKNQISKENFAELVQMVIATQPTLRDEAIRAVEVESRIAQGVISTIGNDYQVDVAEVAAA